MTITLNRRNLVITIIAAVVVLAAYLVGGGRPRPAQAASPNNVSQQLNWLPAANKASAKGGTASPVDLTASAITVTGSGVVTGTPNALQVNLSVSDVAANVSDALATANRAAVAVQQSLATHGVGGKDMQTSGMSIQQHTTNYGTPDGYQVYESLTAQIHDLTTAGATLSAAISAGGNHVQLDGVSVALDDNSTLMADARARAVADAKTKAGQYAAAANRSLGAVLSIGENVAPTYPTNYGTAMAAASGASTSPVPIQAGSTSVTVNITVVFALA